MEDADTRPHLGIPLSHKFLAVVLAAVVAGGGCAALIYQAWRSEAAVLAFNPAVAQSVDPGVASARYPALALADSVLNDESVAHLTEQAHLASTTSTNRIGEFRSELELKQSWDGRLDVRFRAPDATQSIVTANAVARILADWNPSVGNPATAAAPSATGSLSTGRSSGTERQGPSRPPTGKAAPSPGLAANPGLPEHPLPDHSLSGSLSKIELQLTATDQQLERLDAGETQSSEGEQSAHIESREQSLLRSEVTGVQKTLTDLHTRYAKELANPKIGAPLDEIRKAVNSIPPGGDRHGFNAAGFSTSELSGERSALRKAVGIVGQETKKIQLAESANSTSVAKPDVAAIVPGAGTSTGQSVPASLEASPVPAQRTAAGTQKQNMAPTAEADQAVGQVSQNPLSIVRLATPAPRPKFWAAIAAGALCGLLYFGIAAFWYRRSPGDVLYRQMNATTHRLITFPDPVRVDEPADERKETVDSAVEPDQDEDFLRQPAAQESTAAPAENVTPIEPSSALTTSLTIPAEGATVSAEAGSVTQPLEAADDLSSAVAEPVASVDSARAIISTAAEKASPPEALSEGRSAEPPPRSRKEPPAERRSHIWSTESIAGNDPVAERLRRSLADTAVARMFENPARSTTDDSEPKREQGDSEP